MFTSTDDIYENASKVVCNELLCYICCYRDRSNAEALWRAVLTNFSPDDISSAKKLITHEFQDIVTSTTLMTDRRNTTSRLAHEVTPALAIQQTQLMHYACLCESGDGLQVSLRELQTLAAGLACRASLENRL